MAHELLVDKLNGLSGTLLEMGILLFVHARQSEWGRVRISWVRNLFWIEGRMGVGKHTTHSQCLKSSSSLDVDGPLKTRLEARGSGKSGQKFRTPERRPKVGLGHNCRNAKKVRTWGNLPTGNSGVLRGHKCCTGINQPKSMAKKYYEHFLGRGRVVVRTALFGSSESLKGSRYADLRQGW